MPMRVFVGSGAASGELDEERNLARKKIEELTLEPLMRELLPPPEPESEDASGIHNCDAYIGMVSVEASPESLQEIQDVTKLGKACVIFSKKVPERLPTANEFLERAKEFKQIEFSEAKEIPEQLEEVLLDLVASHTLAQLEAKGTGSAYIQSYVQPVFAEIRDIERKLSEKALSALPTTAWNSARGSKFLGVAPELDQRLASFYSQVSDLNGMRDPATSEMGEIVTTIMQEGFLESARNLEGYAEIRNILTDSFEFFWAPGADSYTEAAKPLLNRLDGTLKTMGTEHWGVPFVSGLWLLNKILTRVRMSAVLKERGLMKTDAGVKYLAAFEPLELEAKRINKILQKVAEARI
jgi:hypothetical protein